MRRATATAGAIALAATALVGGSAAASAADPTVEAYGACSGGAGHQQTVDVHGIPVVCEARDVLPSGADWDWRWFPLLDLGANAPVYVEYLQACSVPGLIARHRWGTGFVCGRHADGLYYQNTLTPAPQN